MQQLLAWERLLNSYVWGGPMIILLMGTGVVLTILTGFIQFRHLHTALREVLGKVFSHGEGRGSVTPFQAVATALASTVGVGNIAAIATAIVLGGPGALFWLWISGLLGMCTSTPRSSSRCTTASRTSRARCGAAPCTRWPRA